MSAGGADSAKTAGDRVVPRARPTSRQAVLAVAIVIAAIELLAAAAVVLDYARVGYRSAKAANPFVRDADLDPLAAYAPTAALARATAVIPSDATYAVVVGNDPPGRPAGNVRAAFRFWLLPRRYTTRISEADWIIAFHRSSETLGVRYSREIGLSPAVNAVQVRR
jgi:hypothetical protein